MATKAQRGLFITIAVAGGLFAWLYFTRKNASADRIIPGELPATSGELPPGTAPGEVIRQPAPAGAEGKDLFPRHSVVIVSTAKGTVQFEKELDEDNGLIRWINYDGLYGSYRDIGAVVKSHPPLQILDPRGAVLWQGGQFTLAGQNAFGVPAPVPLTALVLE